MTYRRSTDAYERQGPDGLDLTRTRVRDDAATGRLVAVGLPVLEVSVDQSAERGAIVRWRNAPTIEQQQQAEGLLGYAAQHVL